MSNSIKLIDLFCGLGGFRVAAENIQPNSECMFSCDFDLDSQKSYEANFGEKPFGDITKIHESEIPEHDVLFAGFPCQAFSICGDQKGFEDTRGTLFFNIARILKAKQPQAFVLENVKQLVSHNQGKTFQRILETLENLGYQTHYKILNALDFGLPQKRERVFIVGFRGPKHFVWNLEKVPMKSLHEVLETKAYKPIQIAEVLYYSRKSDDIVVIDLETYRNPSVHWRNNVTRRLANKISTSSARYQHDVWNDSAMPTDFLSVLDTENKNTNGAVEKYIYLRYGERQGTVSTVISEIVNSTPETFQLESLLELFVSQAGIRRSIDKAYEIVVYSLFETIVTALEARIKVSIAEESKSLLQEFSELAKVLLGLDETKLAWEENAHLYRVGVTNAADRGLDMWANFGVAVQVKHLTLSENLANSIVDQVESDSVVIVCKDAEAKVIKVVLKQIG